MRPPLTPVMIPQIARVHARTRCPYSFGAVRSGGFAFLVDFIQDKFVGTGQSVELMWVVPSATARGVLPGAAAARVPG
ncbi:hypothetical protein Q0Z83_052900 [Actinoplanes sichuanensis]|nr:hypothetical protein Q0Z83_052900 [Actinoplanes sichuanensis]